MTKSNDRLNAKYSANTATQNPTGNTATATNVTGSKAQKGLSGLEDTFQQMGEQLGENLTNILVSTAVAKVFDNISQGNYGTVGNNYIDVLNAFSEGIEASNMALLAGESTTNFLPAGSEQKPETASLTVSKLDG